MRCDDPVRQAAFDERRDGDLSDHLNRACTIIFHGLKSRIQSIRRRTVLRFDQPSFVHADGVISRRCGI
jgi:hypothetical protein